MATSDKLSWVFTNYGLNRISEVMADTEDTLNLYKFKIGDANNTFYTPSATQTDLVNTLDTLFIHEKSLSEDSTTVILKTIIPENSDGFDILEVGLYETVDDVDYLFAVSTQQALPKPSVSYNYIISVDYYANFISANLSSVYDQIVIDAQYEYVKEGDLDNLRDNLLYVEGNLSEQITTNTNIIGLDRPEQLNTLIENNLNSTSNSSCIDTIFNILNLTTIDNFHACWLFNYTNVVGSNISIADFTKRSINLSLNKNINLFNRGIEGLAPYIDISGSNSYTLGDDVVLDLLSASQDDDTPFSLFCLLKHNNGSKNTILAKSNYFNNKHIFEINKNANNSLEVIFFTDNSNYIKATTNSGLVNSNNFYTLSVKYNGNKTDPQISIFINGDLVTSNLTETGTYTGMSNIPMPLTSYVKNVSGVDENFIDSKVSLISIVKDDIDNYLVKMISKQIVALSGVDVCQIL